MKYITLILLIVFCSILTSHPHLFLDSEIGIVVSEDNTITGIDVVWKFDQWWSMDVINESDLNRDGFLDEEEVALVYKYYFQAIMDFDFFTEIYINKKKHKITKVEQFNAVIEKDGNVSLRFIYPLKIEPNDTIKFDVRFNDPTIYASYNKTVKLNKNELLDFQNIKISTHGYYGVKAEFEVTQNQ